MTEAQTIYFDESGFTGNNLLNLNQPVFVNSLILHELVDRTLKGRSLFSDMINFITTARRLYRLSPPTYQES